VGIAYRREVDGLRAVAVVPVVLFHAGFSGIGGGYAGVDVFFVISGFLITSIILAEHAAGTFTVLGFYERRVRRILPALLTVMLVSVVPAWFLLVPDVFKNFGKSMAAASVFGSNIFFWMKSGYFAPAAEDMPLLHTWSLAVEEQYYVLFPLLLMLLVPLRQGRLTVVIGCIALASLAFTEWAWRYAPDANFYLLPSRAWELMIGALIAIALAKRDITAVLGTRTRNVLSLVGIALVVGAFVIFDEQTPFPSLYAAIPVLGAALILAAATSDTVVGKVLGSSPFVLIGLISYSIYLWHVPLLSFAKALLLEPDSDAMRVSVIAATFVLAYLTWRFIETPFRNCHAVGRRTVFVAAGCVSAIVGGGGLVITKNLGFPDRFSSYYVAFDKEAERAKSWRYVNHRDEGAQEEALVTASLPERPRLKVGVAGNSHAKDAYNILYFTGLNLKLEPIITNFICEKLSRGSARWKECNFEYVVRPDMEWDADLYVIAPRWSDAHVEALPRVIDRLRLLGKDVVVFGNAAEFDNIPRFFAKSIGFAGDDSVPNLRRIAGLAVQTLRKKRLLKLNRRIRDIALQHGATYVDRLSLLCPQFKCRVLDDSFQYLLYDHGHMMLRGAKYVAKRLLHDPAFMRVMSERAVHSSAN